MRMTRNISSRAAVALGFAVLLAGGCAQSTLEDDFGASVRQMILAQQAHPEISANPDPQAPDGTDAARVEQAVQTYRTDPTQPDDDRQEPVLELETGR